MTREVSQPRKTILSTLARWVDAGASQAEAPSHADAVDWLRVVPFVLMHVACFGVLFVGWSPVAVSVAVALYAARMFAITGFYHRYFSHRAFRTSRAVQFAFACLGASAVQRGPLWWAAHHRDHHRHSDTPEDSHSPGQLGFWRSHMGWFLTRRNFGIRWKAIPDWAAYPELRFLDRFDTVVPVILAASLYGLGEVLASVAPSWGTSGPQMLIWGFFVSTVVLYHITFSVNSVAHVLGRREFETRDDSRNNGLVALLTFGEGWHNNHHRFPAAVRQGIRWWELDLTFYVLWMMEKVGLVSDLKPLPAPPVIREARERHSQSPAETVPDQGASR